jgi:zinc protease
MEFRSAGILGRFVRIALSCTVLLLAPLPPLGAQTTTTALLPVVRTLPNGLRVVVVDDPAAPIVQTALWYRFGANDERPGLTGLAHALAHMMYRGTAQLSGSGLDDVVTRLGGEETATTSNDYTVYRFVVPADRLELILRIEADRMQHLLLSDAAWSNEKEAVLAEYDADLRQPLTQLYSDVCAAATAARICAISSLGNRSDVSRASAEDLRSYFQDWYAPNNATLVVTGDVRPAEVYALAANVFGAIAKTDIPPRQSDVPLLYNAGKTVQIEGDFPYQIVDLAYPAPGTADPGSGALHIVDSIVNNQRSDFYKALIRSGYAVAYSTQLDQNVHGGLYHVFLVTAPGHGSDQVRDAFTGVVESAGQTGFAPDLVAAAKTALAERATYARDSVSGLGDRIGYALAVEGESDPAADDARIAAATPADLTVALRRYLGEPAVIGLLNPEGDQTAQTPSPPSTSVTDDFSRRAPSGKIVEARWVTSAFDTPEELHTRIAPASFTLDNGLRVLVQGVHANPTVFVTGTVETSPRFDQPSKNGEGAMASTLLSFGGAKYGFDAQRAVADQLGATIDVGFDFSAHGRAQDLPKLIDVVADALEHPAFAPADVQLVRKQTLDAIRARDEDPDYRATSDFDRLLLRPDDPTLREATPESVAGITAADLHDYANRHIRPDLTTITVVGDVDPATVAATMRASFGGWHAAGPHESADPGPLPPPHAAQRYVVSERHIVEAHLGQAALTRANPDYYGLNLIDEILGADGSYDTRLMRDLRSRLALVYSASSALDVDRYRGTLNFYLSSDPRRVTQAVAVLRGEVDRLKSDAVGPFELERAKDKVVARAVVAEEATEVIATRVHTIGLDKLPLRYEADLPRRYAAIDGADIERIAQTYLKPSELVEVYEGPRP